MENMPSVIQALPHNLEGLLGEAGPALSGVLALVYQWGWIVLPFLIWPIFLNYWLMWRRYLWEVYERPDPILLEVRPPGEMEKPIRAMESVLNGFWQIWGPPNWYEKWIEGEQLLDFTLEIVGINGVPHFLVRLPKPHRELFESHIYSQYGEAEIHRVRDYTKNVPQNVPNDRWNFMGSSYTMSQDEVFPIRTYKEFETEREKSVEEVVDPLAGLMESIATLKEGEQIWIQIHAKPVMGEDFQESAEHHKQEMMQRTTETPPPRSVFQMVREIISTGMVSEREFEEETEPVPADMLSPGEKNQLEGMERKATKKLFECHIHHMYIAREDVSDMAKFRMPMSYFNNFGDASSNSIIPYGDSITKPSQEWYDWFFFQERRKYLLKRKFFRNYVRRKPMFFPNVLPGGQFILNTEELATLFHFPDEESAPPSILQRVESQKEEAPWELPT